MISTRNIVTILGLFVLVGCSTSGVATKPATRAAVASLGPGFVSESVRVNEATIHYVRGGAGPAVVLIHGFPQDWFAFHTIMPRLAAKFAVVAVDLRGVGGSTMASGAYEPTTLAQDIHELAGKLDLKPVYVV